MSWSVSAQISNPIQYITERPDWAGVWFNTWDYAPDFSELKTKLVRANENDYYFYCELWTGENSPRWIFDNGVPMVNDRYSFYFDENYKKLVTTFFDTLAATVAGYDPELIRRFAFIALCDALDYSDTKRFPENMYGEASRENYWKYQLPLPFNRIE